MLPLKNRLIKSSDFKDVLVKSRKIESGPVFLRIKKNNLGVSRFGFSVGIKFSSKAVLRNKVKRKLREVVRKKLDYLKSGFDVIIIPRKERIKNGIIWEKELEEALKKANLFNNTNKK